MYFTILESAIDLCSKIVYYSFFPICIIEKNDADIEMFNTGVRKFLLSYVM